MPQRRSVVEPGAWSLEPGAWNLWQPSSSRAKPDRVVLKAVSTMGSQSPSPAVADEDRKTEDLQHSAAARRVMLRRHTTGAVSLGETSDVALETDDVDVELIHTDARKQVAKHMSVLFAGGVAGSVGKTVTAPLSRLTILFQVHSMVSTRHTDRFSPTLTSAFTKVTRNEGFLALWKGNGASVLHRFPYSAVNFFTFEMVKTGIIAQGHPRFTENSWTTMFLSGALAGATATVFCYPIDLIRTRLATQLNSDIRYNGILHAAKRIPAEEGFLGLYRGLGATLMVTVPNLAISFSLYDVLKRRMKSFRHFQRSLLQEDDAENADDTEDMHIGVLDTLLCGGGAGIASSLVTFPIDVIRRRLQISGIHAGTHNIAPTPLGIASELYVTQGVRGFYRGLTPELMKVVPMVGITFGMFDRLKKLFVIE